MGTPSLVVSNFELRPRSQVSLCFCHRVTCCVIGPRAWRHPGLTALPPNLQKQKRDEAAINHILEELDTNGDTELTFEEFSVLIARLTVASHEEMHKTAPPGKGHSHGPGFGESRGTCQNKSGTEQSGHGHSHGGHGHGGHGHSHNH